MQQRRAIDGITYGGLESQFDGPIPEQALGTLRHGSAASAARARAAAEISFLTDLARDQLIRLRKQGSGGKDLRGLRADLLLYLRQRRMWRAHARRCQN